MVYYSILLIEHQLDPESLKAIIRPDATDPRTTVAGIASVLNGFAAGQYTASGTGISGTFSIGISGTVPDIEGIGVDTYRLDLQ